MRKLFIFFLIGVFSVMVLFTVLYFFSDNITIKTPFYIIFFLCLYFIIIGIRNPIMVRENLILKKCYNKGFLYFKPDNPDSFLKTDFGNPELNHFRESLSITLPKEISDFEKTKLLVFFLRSRGVKLGKKMEEKPQKSILDLLLSGTKGGCDDYSNILVILCAAHGIYARNIGLGDIVGGGKISHSMFEVYSKEHGKWLLFDGLYNAWFEVDEKPCGLLEARDCMLRKKGVGWKICYINGIDYHSYKNMKKWFKEMCPFVYFFSSLNHLERENPRVRYGIFHRFVPNFFPLAIKEIISLLFGKYKQAYAYYDELTPNYLAPIVKILFYFTFICFPVSIIFIILDFIVF